MSVWGKIAGAGVGLAVGGPIGALIGGFAGHLVDRQTTPATEDDRAAALSVGIIALGAKMAKADGRVTRDEVAAFKEVFTVPPGEAANVARLFDLAKQDTAGFESYARQLATLFPDDPALLEAVLDGLFHIAKADAVLAPTEERYLREVATAFGFGDSEFAHIRARHAVATESSPYQVLGVAPGVPDDELKRAYRRLVIENHPDKLTARGLPAEMVKVANDRLAAITSAYDVLARQRGL